MANWTYVVYVDSTVNPTGGEFGHAYIAVTSPTGETTMVGYYPNVALPGTIGLPGSSGHHVLEGPGIVRDDSTMGRDPVTGAVTQHRYDYATVPKEISPETAQNMLDYIAHVTANPGQYGVFGNNCVEFVEDLMIIAGDRSRLSDVVPPIWLKGQLYLLELFSGMNGINDIDYDINGNVNTNFTSARNWVPRRDPLVLDLNGGGISTSGINPAAPLYFDHAGDGVPNATGWVGAGEGLVVRDLNGNGWIDSGRELFGDNTVLTRASSPRLGQNALDGFDALRDLDSNGDNKFDASDAAFASVKIWKDLNQNAISETGELFTLADAGVQSVGLSASASNLNLVDASGTATGNTQTFTGSFTRVGGGTGTAGTAELVGNLLLANNNFYRQFNDDPALTPKALTPASRRARRAPVPIGLRARGRGACVSRLSSHQHRGLRSNSVASANWRRPTGTDARHACGGGWCAGKNCQRRPIQMFGRDAKLGTNA